jgi:effector-binding domain-containing protein
VSNATFRAERRDAVTYVALPVAVTMRTIAERIGEAYEQLDRYLASRGIQPNGPSMVRYRVLDMDHSFTIEVGWEVAENTWVDLPYVADVLPGGRYAVASYTGPYSRLDEVAAETMMWADLQNLTFDVEPGARGDVWASRLERYLDEPRLGVDGLEGPTEVCIRTLD